MSAFEETNTDTAAAVRAGELIGEPKVLSRGDLLGFVVPEGAELEIVDTAHNPLYTGEPERMTGSPVVWTPDSFNALWSKYSVDGVSEVFADLEAFTVTAVFDAHHPAAAEAPVAGWQQHRAKLVVRKTVQWLAWEALDGRYMDQVAFSEHIENRQIDFVSPDGATMYELAQSFQATTSVDFESSQILSSSQRKLVFKETVAAKAGQRGEIEIPALFELALKPFEGSPAYRVLARFRYRIREGNLSLSYKIERPEDILQAAFNDVVAEVEGHVDPVPVLRGTP